MTSSIKCDIFLRFYLKRLMVLPYRYGQLATNNAYDIRYRQCYSYRYRPEKKVVPYSQSGFMVTDFSFTTLHSITRDVLVI